MQPSQVLILVSVLFGVGGLLLGFLLGSAWAMRQRRATEAEEAPSEAISSPEEPLAEDVAELEPSIAEAVQTLPEETLTEPIELPMEIANPVIPEPAIPTKEPALPPEPEDLPKPVPPSVDHAIRTFAKQPTKPQPKPAAPLSIIEQINVIFNQMVADTPLAERNIRLVQEPTLGVTVQVGEEKFESIDSVPDEEIRAALKAAVKKWEEG